VSPLERLVRVLQESSDPANPGPRLIQELLATARILAVVGISRDPTKAARRVPSYLATRGYEIVPVNPFAERILGRPVRASLAEVEEVVHMVVVFRPSAEAGEVVRQAAARRERPAIWLQEGIRNDDAAASAREAGLTVIQDLCLFKVHRSLEGELSRATAWRDPG